MKSSHPPSSSRSPAPRPVSPAIGTSPATSDRLRLVWLLGLAGLVTATPLIPSESAGTLGVGVVFVLSWLLITIGWLAGYVLNPDQRVRFGWSEGTFLVCIVLQGVSAWMAVADGNLRATVNSVWQWVGFGLSFLLVRSLPRGSAEGRALIAVSLATAIGLSTYAYYQYFVSMPETRREYRQDPDAALAKIGLNAPAGSALRRQFEDRLESREPVATFSLTNSLAGFLVPWFLVSVPLVVGLLYSDQPGRRARIAAALGMLLMAGCLVLTKSRTAWLATLVGLGLLLVYGRRGGWKPPVTAVLMIVSAGLGLILFGLAVGGLDWLVVAESAKSLRYRVEYWQGAMGIIADHPWWGCGPGNFQQAYTQYKLPQASETVAEPHNFVLEIWSTAGTPALLAFLAFGIAIVRECRPSRDSPSEVGNSDAGLVFSGVRWTYLGSMAGWVVAYPIGWIVGYPPDEMLLLTAWPLAAATLFGLHGWVIEGRLPRWLLAIPAIALLLNLFAAGGISFAGVNQSLWVLLALLPGSPDLGERDQRWPRLVWAGLLGAAIVLLALFLRTGYYPVTEAAGLVEEGGNLMRLGRFTAAEEKFRAAAERDPWSAAPWLALAEMQLAAWQATQQPARLDALETCVDELIRRLPVAHRTAQQVGDWWSQVYRRSGKREHLERARVQYLRGVQLYPNSSSTHAYAAWTQALSGDRQAAATHAEEALRLDSLNPHREQKLDQLYLPRVDRGGGSSSPEINAEQQMQQLRTGSGTS